MGTPSDATVAVTGSLILIYTLWAGLTLTEGAKGKWAVIHPSMFCFIAIVASTYVGSSHWRCKNWKRFPKDGLNRWTCGNAANNSAYFRLRDEGMEDGMTI